MASEDVLPGTPQHQRLLRAVVEHYRDDLRVVAVIVFGSLARGNWDTHSDLDLDIVVADGVSLDVTEEAIRLCASLAPFAGAPAVISPKRSDEVDLVLTSLDKLSIRYHPLATTSPNIIASMRLLWGGVSLEAIRTAGLANRSPERDESALFLGHAVRAIVEADTALQRGRLWFALEQLGEVRDGLIELYGAVRGEVRPLPAFQDGASQETRAALASLVPQPTLVSAQIALIHAISVLECDLALFAGDRIALSDEQRVVLSRVRARQAGLVLD